MYGRLARLHPSKCHMHVAKHTTDKQMGQKALGTVLNRIGLA
jgi:hypothetical protein